MHALALLAGLYLAFAVVDHILFFYQDRENTGMINLELIEAKDIPCKSIALVWMQEDTARYRCPEKLVFGGIFYPDPFVPWPSYTEGNSYELKGALDALKTSAVNPPKGN